MEPADLLKIVQTLRKYFDFSFLTEFTLEANPETVSYNKFEEFHSLGVNRISMGAQSFNDKTLKILGRVHNSRQIYKAFGALRKAEFDNINLDLMFALPGESLKETMYSLTEAIKLSPEHISYYSLTIEEDTKFYKEQDKLKLPDEDLDYKEYREGIEILEKNGFIHYEISNFAKRGFQSEHNKRYWRNLSYLGFGVSSYSYLKRERFGNTNSLGQYCRYVDEGLTPVSYREKLTDIKAKAEHIILNLRLLNEGVNRELYYIRFGTFPNFDFAKQIEKLKNFKLIKEYSDKIVLTKRGMFLANDVFTEFLP